MLFCVLPERGHVNPCIAPAQALVGRGAEVAFWSSADLSEQLARAGLAFIGERASLPAAARGEEMAALLRDPARLRAFIRALLLDVSRRDAIRATIETFHPDVVAIDPLLYAAAIAAHEAGVPWAAVSNSLNPALPQGLDSELLRTVRALDAERAALFARYGMTPSFRGCDVLSPYLTIAFATEALVGPAPGVCLVGPSLPWAARGDETDWTPPLDPFVYASFGSQAYWQPARLRRLIDATAALDVRLVASVADLDLGPLPPHVTAARYVPQLEVLRRASALVTHGGANSVMEALACGVPMLISPLGNDQPHQAELVRRAGVGLAIDLDACGVDDLRAALRSVLTDVPMRAASRALADAYARDGGDEAARLILALTRGAGSRPATAS